MSKTEDEALGFKANKKNYKSLSPQDKSMLFEHIITNVQNYKMPLTYFLFQKESIGTIVVIMAIFYFIVEETRFELYPAFLNGLPYMVAIILGLCKFLYKRKSDIL